ncbi:glycosyltransferase, TPR domain-containing [Citrifermentans bemidjiense Bem]|uniref:Glycosyltransferase, TPR domain-containing n=1 Tax=Citrifermentans bemidjiense (strain ATCC BAA-1014 / DSM 16622 / JCM 12645 / Bem) TaxID=404380 RepID=B5EDT2_CITBB|nr:tetratricopeptide repeat protein [Citrifermentans bemidjiense]ACH40710.1 glycosyltransferase, TPR domain-containing [Citrifermentans bemidjiense Bem]
MSQLVTRPSGAVAVLQDGPLLSAILITSNRESHLRECLCELMQQSISNRMEVIVVDQGSEQCEWAVVADLQKIHPNLISLKLPAAAGGKGVEMALRIASGKYATLLEATDRLKRDAYELLTAALEGNPAAMLAYGDTCFTAIPHESFASHTSYGKVIWPDYTSQQLAQLSEVAPHPVWRRELHDSVGFLPQGYPNHGMREFMLKVVERFRILHLEEFTGLKLITANQAPVQAAHPQARPQPAPSAYRAPEPEPVIPAPPVSFEQPSAPAAPVYSQSAAAASTQTAGQQKTANSELKGADQAYQELRSVVTGEDPQRAAAALREHLARFPKHAMAHNDLAAVSYQLGEKEQALKHYREAVWLDPKESVYLKNLADILFVEAGEADEAIAIYLKLLEQSPRDVETLLNLGIICESVGQPAEADSFYQRALEIEPWNQAARQQLTALRQRTEEPQSAAAPEEDDLCAEDRYQRSQELVSQGDLDGAFQELKQILSSYPDFAPAHNDLAVLAYQQGDKEQARAHYEKAAELAPENGTFQKNLADFYFVEGYDVDGAIAIYLEQLRREPKNIETLMGLGKICTMLDRPTEAQSFYGKVINLEPWNRDARDCLNSLKEVANG